MTELLSKQVLLSIKHKGFLKNFSVSCLFLEFELSGSNHISYGLDRK